MKKVLDVSNLKAFPDARLTVALFFNPLPDEKILDWSKLKKIADNILKRIRIEK